MTERQDIIEGLKNALERGYSIDIAISSFINAGYNRQDVEDSAKTFGGVYFQESSKPTAQQATKSVSQPLSQTANQTAQPIYRPAIQTNPRPILPQQFSPQLQQPLQTSQPPQTNNQPQLNVPQPTSPPPQMQNQQFQPSTQIQQTYSPQYPQQTSQPPKTNNQPQTQSSQSESKSGNILESKNITVNAQNVSVQTKPKKSGGALIVFLIVLLVVLLAGLFTLVFAREQVVSFLASMGITF